MTADKDDSRAQLVERMAAMTRAFHNTVPLNVALGFEVGEIGDGWATMSVPWRDDLVGDPESGIIHGGVITALIDACCGMAAFMGLPAPSPIATLDLRIDYLRPAVARRTVITRAECYQITRQVAFTRAFAHQGDEDRPVASSLGTFMIKQPSADARRTEPVKADGSGQ